MPRDGATRDPKGIIKMVADAKTDEVLGVTMIGNSAGVVIHEAAMALRFRAKLHDFIDPVARLSDVGRGAQDRRHLALQRPGGSLMLCRVEEEAGRQVRR